MKTRIGAVLVMLLTITLMHATDQRSGDRPNLPLSKSALSRPMGPCDVYAAAGNPCAAAHSTTRALYASYNGPLYQVLRQSDGNTLDIGVVQPKASPVADPGGYADASAQDAFCANTYCWITKVYDQSPEHNDLVQPARGGFSGPAMGGFNNLPLADAAPITVMGHKVYGVFVAPGMGLRNDDPKGTAVDDQAEGQYWVINGLHFNNGCCFDYGNAEIDSRDDDNGTMETTYYGNATPWYHGSGSGPWIMTDQENNLVGCVNPDGTKSCPSLPTVSWRFVTAMAKGEPHHWSTLGGDAQQGALSIMFDGGRVNSTYDPMRKQGAILLGNGGDNSNGSQGTFYEGAMTAAGTFPTDATDQQVQANVVAAGYAVLPLSLAPASAAANPPGAQSFSPGSSQDTKVTFTNSTGAPAKDVRLSILVPNARWKSVAMGTAETSKTFAGPVAAGASVSATFRITSGAAPSNGDLVGEVKWTNAANGTTRSEKVAEKVRNVEAVKINEFRLASGPLANSTDTFIELYNAGDHAADISSWTLTVRPTQQAVFSTAKIPAGTKLAAHSFYLFGLSNSGLAAPARAGDTTVHLRSTTGMSVGDAVMIGSGSDVETHKIATLGTPASGNTTLWQPLPDGPIITIPKGSGNVPVTSAAEFRVGEKIALGYGATFPVVGRGLEQYEVATVTAVGKSGTQAYLAEDAPAGSSNIKVSSAADISAGDIIRLDVDTKGHGIETVTVTHVGTEGSRTNLSEDAAAGATRVSVRSARNFAAGDTVSIGTQTNRQSVSVSSICATPPACIEFTPALQQAHHNGEGVVKPGTGLDLAAPLKFSHAANLPFSDRGTGISFQPATAFDHSSNEPVQALGSGIILDGPLKKNYPIHAVVRDAAVKNAGYQGGHTPNQWFGGPELATDAPFFERHIVRSEGSMVLRDASGLVADSLNYGGLVDPWAAEGYQATSGTGRNGCYIAAPGWAANVWPPAPAPGASDVSAGRVSDGQDTDSNCSDFVTAPATTLLAPASTGVVNLKVASVTNFSPSQTIRIGTGADLESVVIASVGTAGATTVTNATTVGATVIPIGGITGFEDGETITIGAGADAETAEIAGINRRTPSLTVNAPLKQQHSAGEQVSGTGITLTSALKQQHANGDPVAGNASTPGAPNRY